MNTTSSDGAFGARRKFPDGFLWGVATSAYQIEGAVAEDGRGPSVWDGFSHTPGNTNRGDTGDIACDSYHRLGEDLELLRDLGAGAYRFSIAWPRIQPTGRGLNRVGLDHYRALVDGLRRREIVPMATLYHWDLPQVLEDEGGWANRETAERFAEYARIVAEALGDGVGLWITVSEPQVVASQGYRLGTHAPGHTDNALAAASTHHLLVAHGLALQALRAALPEGTKIGVTLDLHPIRAAGEDASAAAELADAEQNRIFLDPVLHGSYPDLARPEMLPPPALIRPGDMELISAPVDFLGVNYYCPHYVKRGNWADLRMGEAPRSGHPGVVDYAPAELPRTPMDWLVEPEALYDLLTMLSSEAPGLPLYITENGCAADDYVSPEGEINDLERVSFLYRHIDAARRAVQEGVNLAGYFVWSLMDNFEWAWGYGQRFGLVFVDFASQHRVPKRSAGFFLRVATANALPPWDSLIGERDGVGVDAPESPAQKETGPLGTGRFLTSGEEVLL